MAPSSFWRQGCTGLGVQRGVERASQSLSNLGSHLLVHPVISLTFMTSSQEPHVIYSANRTPFSIFQYIFFKKEYTSPTQKSDNGDTLGKRGQSGDALSSGGQIIVNDPQPSAACLFQFCQNCQHLVKLLSPENL